MFTVNRVFFNYPCFSLVEKWSFQCLHRFFIFVLSSLCILLLSVENHYEMLPVSFLKLNTTKLYNISTTGVPLQSVMFIIINVPYNVFNGSTS